MGVLAHRLFTLDDCPPLNRSEHFLEHMSATPPSKIFSNPSEVICKVLKMFLGVESLYLGELGAHAKSHDPRTISFGRERKHH